jgi:hypothetical protein
LAVFEEGLSLVGGVTMLLNAASQFGHFRLHTRVTAPEERDGIVSFS